MYLRISIDRTGEMLAVERQREDCLSICEARGWQVLGEYVDNSVSASDARKARPGYDELVKAYDAGMFDALVCYDLDRLTRQPRQLEDWIDRARDRGLVIVTANGEADLSTDAGMMFARIKAAVARAEVDRKSARQRRAAQQRADKGRPPTGVRLTGYTAAGDVVPREAEIVRRIFEQFAAGESLKGIAAGLQADRVKTRRGGRWSPSSITTILRNPRYAGRAVYQGQATGKAGTWQPLVTDDLFATVQARLDDPRRKLNKTGTDRRWLGSGLYMCSACGGRMSSFSGARYRCADGCHSRARGQVDDYVLAVLRERLCRPDMRDLVRTDRPAAAPLEADARRLRTRIQRVADDYDAGVIDGTRYAVATDRARVELADIDRKLAALHGGDALAGVLDATDPVVAFDQLSLMGRRGVLDALMAVTLHAGTRGNRNFDPNSVEITWKSSIARVATHAASTSG